MSYGPRFRGPKATINEQFPFTLGNSSDNSVEMFVNSTLEQQITLVEIKSELIRLKQSPNETMLNYYQRKYDQLCHHLSNQEEKGEELKEFVRRINELEDLNVLFQLIKELKSSV